MKREKPNKPALKARDLAELRGLLRYNKIYKENIKTLLFYSLFSIQKDL